MRLKFGFQLGAAVDTRIRDDPHLAIHSKGLRLALNFVRGLQQRVAEPHISAVALGRVLPPHQAPAELQVALRVTESLEALPEQVDVLLAMSAMMAQDGQHGKARALNEQALELLPSWHEKAREIRRALSGAADGKAEQ